MQRIWAVWMTVGMLACGGAGGDDGSKDAGPSGDTDTDADADADSDTDADTDTDTDADTDTSAPTWHDDIAPIVAEHCASCHQSDGVSFPMTSYDAGRAWALAAQIKLHGDVNPPYQMPPWFSDSDDCDPPRPWVNDERLSDAELATYDAWVAAGMPEGMTAAFPDVDAYDLGGDTLVRTAAPFSVPATGPDMYQCFPMDPGLTSQRWITGLQVNPDVASVVHHVVIFADPTGAGAGRAGADGSYPCFGSAGVPEGDVLFAWAPGAVPLEVPANSGIPVRAGGGVVMQVHYHTDGTARQDATTVDVRWTDTQPQYTAAMSVFGVVTSSDTNHPYLVDPPFDVPADVPSHQEVIRQPLEVPSGADVRLWSVFSHMHVAGRDIEVTLEHDASPTCLAHNPSWDFGWQRTYVYDGSFTDLPRVYDGDVIEVSCTYDTTLGNPVLVDALVAEGISGTIGFGAGEETTDEMCVAIVGILY
jgi:mono/diheme cytochrome c family protein